MEEICGGCDIADLKINEYRKYKSRYNISKELLEEM